MQDRYVGDVGGFLSGMIGGIYFAAAHLWPLWDRDRQALHDKMIGTLVVRIGVKAGAISRWWRSGTWASA